MKVLLTGGAGYIGSHTAVELMNRGYGVVIVDNYSNSKPVVIERIAELTGRRPAAYDADVCDETAMLDIFRRELPDAVIHFAGLKAVGESVAKPVEYYRNNLNSTLTLCAVMRRCDVRTIIFSSSATVYAPSEVMPLTEDSPLGCYNPYGWTKHMSEQILTDAAAANEGWFVGLLRYFNPIGAHESGRIGEDPNGIPNNLLPNVTQVAAGKREMLKVLGTDYPTPDGTGVRDYIHVVDLALGHIAALEYSANNRGVLTVNLGTGRGYSVLEVVEAFERENGISIPRQLCERRPGDIAMYYADPTRAKELLGWSAKKDINDMVRDSWRWQSANPEGYPES